MDKLEKYIKEDTTAKTSTEYYCVRTGPAYPEQVFKKYEEACSQAKGELTQIGASGGTLSREVNFFTEFDYDFKEFTILKENITKISEKINTNCKSANKEACINQTLKSFSKKPFNWSFDCEAKPGDKKDFSQIKVCAHHLLIRANCLYKKIIGKTK